MNKETIDQVIKMAGGPSKLARHLGVSPQAISQWKRVPLNHVFAIEKLTDIPRYELRPDVYPKEAA